MHAHESSCLAKLDQHAELLGEIPAEAKCRDREQEPRGPWLQAVALGYKPSK